MRPEESTTGHLVAALRDEDESVRRAAAEALGQIADPQALEPLVLALRDEDNDVREAAARALARIDPSVFARLAPALAEDDRPLLQVGVSALAEFGDARVVEPLMALLTDRDRAVRASAADGLGKAGDARAVGPLLTMLEEASRHSDDSSSERSSAVEALGQIGSTAVEPLVAVLGNHEKDARVRAAAAEVLGRIGDAWATHSLVAGLTDDNIGVRVAASKALGQIRDAGTTEPLVAALADPNHAVRQEAAGALRSLGWWPEDDTQRALHAVAKQDWREARRMGEASICALVAVLGDADAEVRREALSALQSMRWSPADASQSALRAVAANEWDAAVRLGSTAVTSLLTMIEETAFGEWSRAKAAWALGEIGDPRAVGPLLGRLKDTGEDIDVRTSARDGLAKIGDPAVAPLIAALNDEDSTVRAYAAEALGMIGRAGNFAADRDGPG